MTAVSVENITKRYGKTVALDGVSFEVEKGELFGIIGPDGAGKTTLFRIIATLILADSGTASVDGFDVVRDYKELRKRIGYMPGRFSLYQDLTVEENLSFFAAVFGTTIREGITIVVSTPYMDEANLCDRIALIKGGRFLQIDTPQNIRQGFSAPLWAVRSEKMHRLLDDVRAFPGVDNCYAFGETHHFTACEGFDADGLRSYLEGLGHTAVCLQPAKATIEDCYMLLAKQ